MAGIKLRRRLPVRGMLRTLAQLRQPHQTPEGARSREDLLPQHRDAKGRFPRARLTANESVSNRETKKLMKVFAYLLLTFDGTLKEGFHAGFKVLNLLLFEPSQFIAH